MIKMAVKIPKQVTVTATWFRGKEIRIETSLCHVVKGMVQLTPPNFGGNTMQIDNATVRYNGTFEANLRKDTPIERVGYKVALKDDNKGTYLKIGRT